MGQGGILEADITDRASVETDRALELRTRDRARKLVSKIDQAVQRIETGQYGYCEETGEPIGLKRLEARPIATLSLEAQERHAWSACTATSESVLGFQLSVIRRAFSDDWKLMADC